MGSGSVCVRGGSAAAWEEAGIGEFSRAAVARQVYLLPSVLPVQAARGGDVLFELHFHTIYSDGFLTPSVLFERAHRNGVKVLALTDHDTMAGMPEAVSAASRFGMRIIPGVEISALYNPRAIITKVLVECLPHILYITRFNHSPCYMQSTREHFDLDDLLHAKLVSKRLLSAEIEELALLQL